MAKIFKFHGAFGTKSRARKKEKRVKKSFILKVKVRGKTRYAVVTKRRR